MEYTKKIKVHFARLNKFTSSDFPSRTKLNAPNNVPIKIPTYKAFKIKPRNHRTNKMYPNKNTTQIKNTTSCISIATFITPLSIFFNSFFCGPPKKIIHVDSSHIYIKQNKKKIPCQFFELINVSLDAVPPFGAPKQFTLVCFGFILAINVAHLETLTRWFFFFLFCHLYLPWKCCIFELTEQ